MNDARDTNRALVNAAATDRSGGAAAPVDTEDIARPARLNVNCKDLREVMQLNGQEHDVVWRDIHVSADPHAQCALLLTSTPPLHH